MLQLNFRQQHFHVTNFIRLASLNSHECFLGFFLSILSREIFKQHKRLNFLHVMLHFYAKLFSTFSNYSQLLKMPMYGFVFKFQLLRFLVEFNARDIVIEKKLLRFVECTIKIRFNFCNARLRNIFD